MDADELLKECELGRLVESISMLLVYPYIVKKPFYV
jgi:hypothetical protein